jgi:YidC/Oxa1 family membrane protein insertase
MRAAGDDSLGSLRGAEWRCVRDLDWAAEHPAQAERSWRYLATDVLLELRMPAPGEKRAWDYVIFAGPKDRELLARDDAAHEVLVDKDLGFFNTIARVLLVVLGLFEGLTGNWGVAIILLTLTVRALLFPVNRRSQTAMARYSAKMKRLQPQIDELKKRYESDPQKLRAAQAELMQKEGAFPPLGGCLPMFVQLPIFFGLYQALRTSFDLRQAPFLGWITDLSQPDRLLRLDLHTGLPILGTIEYLNVLPPLMVVLWVGQQMTMPKPADEQAAKMQRMMMFMPVVMGVFLYNYAAGLSLYMITQSSLGIFEQHVIKRVWPVDDTAPVKKKSTGFMARMMERAQQAQRQAEARNRRSSGGKGGGKGPRRR